MQRGVGMHAVLRHAATTAERSETWLHILIGAGMLALRTLFTHRRRSERAADQTVVVNRARQNHRPVRLRRSTYRMSGEQLRLW